MAILGVLSLLVIQVLSSSLRIKKREDARVEVQQNVRAAAQIIAEDLRSSTLLHVWNADAGDCASGVPCTGPDQLAVLVVTGVLSRVPATPGSAFSGATLTPVCDARGFVDGGLALLSNGAQVALLRVTQVEASRDPALPCSPSNADLIHHDEDPTSGTWSNSPYLLKADLITYRTLPDPGDPGRNLLFRSNGYDLTHPLADGTGVVAFDIQSLSVEYGVPQDPGDPSSRLVFFPSLEDAASFLGTGYTALPDGAGTYVGRILKAIRITLTGSSPASAASTYRLTQTVELRR